ncbi:MAG TPA: serine/threonine-protein kinase [Solirubrobacteraceae bacterium]|nr:serine/threonine-protein kinase [Solirubrobacteraceae bacterium]
MRQHDKREGLLEPGTKLGQYRISDLLGEGGMGHVYRASTAEGETVALKVMKKQFASSKEYSRRFLHEARAASEVEHSHLVGVLDFGEALGRQYLAMRYVPGQTLEQRLERSGPLPIEDVLRLAAEVGSALDALHEKGLVHRDIKSSNIILDPSGSAALTDFGLAKGQGYSTLTRPGQVMGTLDYIAPESILGKPATPRSDLYSFGCVVFECVAGEPPFGGKSIFEVGSAVLGDEPPDPCEKRDDATSEFSQAVRLALAKEPDARPPTATAYGNLLRAAANAGR